MVKETAPYAIEIKNLVNKFGNQVIHDKLNLNVHAGEILGVVGASGSGKTVLMHTILRLHMPTSGSIKIKGEDYKKSAVLNSQTGVLFQSGALFSSLTVLENIMFPMREMISLPPQYAEELAYLRLKMVGLPENAAAKLPSHLSGGMIKRVSLARALAIDPKLLFLDEPTSGLDPLSADELDHLILDLSRQLGLTVFMITHDLNSLTTICDRVAVLVNHKATVGTLEEIQSANDPWIHDYFNGPRGKAAFNVRES